MTIAQCKVGMIIQSKVPLLASHSFAKLLREGDFDTTNFSISESGVTCYSINVKFVVIKVNPLDDVIEVYPIIDNVGIQLPQQNGLMDTDTEIITREELIHCYKVKEPS